MKKQFAIRGYSPTCDNNESLLIWKGLVADPDFSTAIETAAATMRNGTSRGETDRGFRGLT
jgi:hypothetical protein